MCIQRAGIGNASFNRMLLSDQYPLITLDENVVSNPHKLEADSYHVGSTGMCVHLLLGEK